MEKVGLMLTPEEQGGDGAWTWRGGGQTFSSREKALPKTETMK